MRANIRKWFALGALASVALVYPGCKSDSRDPAAQNADSMMLGDSQEQGTGGSGTASAGKKKGTHSQASDAGTPTSTDAGTGGAGAELPGTKGQGVSGSDAEQTESTGYSNSGGLPAQ